MFDSSSSSHLLMLKHTVSFSVITILLIFGLIVYCWMFLLTTLRRFACWSAIFLEFWALLVIADLARSGPLILLNDLKDGEI